MSLKAFNHLLDYRHEKANDKLYKRAVRTWEAYMSRSVDVERAYSGGEIARGSSANGGRAVGSISPSGGHPLKR